MLDIIRKGGFSDAVIVVTRYFGGILLGAGGLVRAYSAAAKLAVDAAGIVVYDVFRVFTLKCSYQDYGKLSPLPCVRVHYSGRDRFCRERDAFSCDPGGGLFRFCVVLRRDHCRKSRFEG